jgi:hypothetical protein
MDTKFDAISKSLNVETEIIDVKDAPKSIQSIENKIEVKQDLKKDYEYSRGQLYSLIEKGQEALNGILEVAGEGGSPRAYEDAGQLIKNVGDVTDKLIDLQKKLKDIEENEVKTTNNVTNNALFVGSTADLSKLLKQ